MNQFIFCAVVDGQIQYGTLQAQSGSHARQILDARYAGRDVQRLEIKGVASKTFDFEVMGGYWRETGDTLHASVT